MTIGVFGYAEHVITEPLSPKDIVKIIYDMCMPADPIEAVLQQEVGVVWVWFRWCESGVIVM